MGEKGRSEKRETRREKREARNEKREGTMGGTLKNPSAFGHSLEYVDSRLPMRNRSISCLDQDLNDNNG